jgi:DNA (cytosine-5)-methyltransferase 1
MKTAVGLFAGVGGIELGFKRSGFEVVWANEIDKKASITYRLNHNHPLATEDLNNIKSDDIPDMDILLAGFPCQAFSVAGYRRGFEDERGNVFFQLVRVIRDKKPPIIFLENVKNLVGHDNGNTFRVILDMLHQNGYFIKTKVMNASDYGNIPQNRERIYIVGFLNEKQHDNFEFPKPVELTKTLTDLIDFNNKVDVKYYYTREKYKFYDELEREMTNMNTLYQWRRVYVRENKSNLCPTLTANMGTGGHNVPLILTKHGIRKLTPKECFNLQGFPDDFKLPNVAQSHLYKQAGNSVVVPIIERIADKIKKAI